ncbi:hypothetical protein GCM10017691_42300 [Pseudonocardia petroleophila]|uniref:Beta-lactamase n=1 Tax=Pseudonocardia petroleophila TaxID=37331 RepID=A0A7G7MBC7_9PSEU|nr:serine hydrolase [Pseudonocardia petroleophila]QNG50088.1 serine hydrolase [Pseudonocardia petroleophila]
MTLTRRRLLGGTALLAVAAACGSPAPAPAAGPVDGPEALVDWIAAHPDHASVLVDDGRGAAFAHLADRPRPIASSVKVTHLAAYALAVEAGRIDPAGPVAVAGWERWYLPGSDADAHPRALAALGTPDTVTWDDVVASMIDYSDNAAADLVLATLGPDALTAAAGAGGWDGLDVPHIVGEALWVLQPDAGGDRRSRAAELGRAYADGDPAARALGAVYSGGPLPGGGGGDGVAAPVPEDTWNAVVGLWDGAWAGTATQLAALHRAVATDALGPLASGIARRHLERAVADRLPPGVLGLGQKGGSLPGVLSYAATIRRDDGTVGVSVLALSGLPQQAHQEIEASGALLLGQRVLVDDAVRDRLAAAVAG